MANFDHCIQPAVMLCRMTGLDARLRSPEQAAH
jgi:hypothetical protein